MKQFINFINENYAIISLVIPLISIIWSLIKGITKKSLYYKIYEGRQGERYIAIWNAPITKERLPDREMLAIVRDYNGLNVSGAMDAATNAFDENGHVPSDKGLLLLTNINRNKLEPPRKDISIRNVEKSRKSAFLCCSIFTFIEFALLMISVMTNWLDDFSSWTITKIIFFMSVIFLFFIINALILLIMTKFPWNNDMKEVINEISEKRKRDLLTILMVIIVILAIPLNIKSIFWFVNVDKPDIVIDDNWYYIETTYEGNQVSSWDEAQKACKEKGGRLATFETTGSFEQVYSKITDNNWQFLIGGKTIANETNFTWKYSEFYWINDYDKAIKEVNRKDNNQSNSYWIGDQEPSLLYNGQIAEKEASSNNDIIISKKIKKNVELTTEEIGNSDAYSNYNKTRNEKVMAMAVNWQKNDGSWGWHDTTNESWDEETENGWSTENMGYICVVKHSSASIIEDMFF